MEKWFRWRRKWFRRWIKSAAAINSTLNLCTSRRYVLLKRVLVLIYLMFFAKRFLWNVLEVRMMPHASYATSMITKSVFALTLLILTAPDIVHGDELGSLRDIQRFFIGIQTILDILIPLIVTLAALVFFWGMVKFLYAVDDPKQRDDGKGLMIWGVIALFIMISVWGFTELIASLFGINQGATIIVPSVPTPDGGGFGGSSI